jgi:hypothetical protein
MARNVGPVSICVLANVLLLIPLDAYAYIGPGTGLTALGALLSVVGMIFFAIVGLIWYPLKRLIKFLRLRARSGKP